MIIKLLLIGLSLTLVFCDGPKDYKIREDVELKTKLDKRQLEMKKLGLKVEFTWLTPLSGSTANKNELLVILKNQQGRAVNLKKNQNLEFYSIMPSMGHPMADAGYFESIEPGIFINKNIVFNMPGDWRMMLTIYDHNYRVLDKVEWDEFW